MNRRGPGCESLLRFLSVITVPANYPGNPAGRRRLGLQLSRNRLPTTLMILTPTGLSPTSREPRGWDIDGSLGVRIENDLKELSELEPGLRSRL